MNDQTAAALLPVIALQSGEYRVNLPSFEGPLDLLLYLIRKHDVEIRDIPIALLTEEYLQYLDGMRALDIDLAGEFLVMAAELAHIKSQMLLPVTPTEDAEEIDPRLDLVRRLLMYQRYKEAAATLERRPQLHRETFACRMHVEEPKAADRKVAGGNVFLLVDAFDKVLKRVPEVRTHNVAIDRISVNQRIMEIYDGLLVNRAIDLETLLPTHMTKYDVVITFLALLEMARMFVITLFQAGESEPIYITRLADAAPLDLSGLTFN